MSIEWIDFTIAALKDIKSVCRVIALLTIHRPKEDWELYGHLMPASVNGYFGNATVILLTLALISIN